MQFPVEVKIEMSPSGKTFGIAFTKNDKVLYVTKGCRLVNGQNGPFISGPSTKMDDGKWFNYLYIDKEFGAYLTKLALEAAPAPAPQQSRQSAPDMSDVPF